MEWDEEITFHLYCNKDLWTEFISRSELRARLGGTMYSQWVQWLWWPSPQMPAAHPAPLSIWPYVQRSEIIFWSDGSLSRIDGVSLKTLSHGVWDYILNLFCYPGVLESFAVRILCKHHIPEIKIPKRYRENQYERKWMLVRSSWKWDFLSRVLIIFFSSKWGQNINIFLNFFPSISIFQLNEILNWNEWNSIELKLFNSMLTRQRNFRHTFQSTFQKFKGHCKVKLKNTL